MAIYGKDEWRLVSWHPCFLGQLRIGVPEFESGFPNLIVAIEGLDFEFGIEAAEFGEFAEMGDYFSWQFHSIVMTQLAVDILFENQMDRINSYECMAEWIIDFTSWMKKKDNEFNGWLWQNSRFY